MTDLFQEPEDATPLDPELRDGLLQTWISTRDDLNEAEQENIVKGAAWARRSRGGPLDMLNDDFAKTLHKQMFGEVWKWAGTPRQKAARIEATISPHLIAAEMPVIFDNVRFWLNKKTFPNDEIAARLHHRLTQIHPYPNGNGRHARMMADLMLERLNEEAFTWGGADLADAGTVRKKYIDSLKAADGHDFRPLIGFARS